MRITRIETARRVIQVAMAALLAAGGAGGGAVGLARSQAAGQPPAQPADPLAGLVQQESETQTNLTVVLQRLAMARGSKVTYEIWKEQADATLRAAEAVTKSRRDEVKRLKPAAPVAADNEAEWTKVEALKAKLEKRAVEVKRQLTEIADWERANPIIALGPSPRQVERDQLEFEDKILRTGFSNQESIETSLRSDTTRWIWDGFWRQLPAPYNDGDRIKDKLVGAGFIRYLGTEATRLLQQTPQPAPAPDPNTVRQLKEAEEKLEEAVKAQDVATRKVAELGKDLDLIEARIPVVEAEAAAAQTKLRTVQAQIKAMRDQRAQALLAEQQRLEAEEDALYAEVKALIDQARGQLVAEGSDGKQLRVSFRSHDEAAETIGKIETKVTECTTKQFNRTQPDRTVGWCDQAQTVLQKLRTAHTEQQKKLTEMKGKTQDLVRQATAACGTRDHKVCARLLTAAYRSVQPCMNTADPACLKAAAKIVVVLHYLYPSEQRERLNRALGVSSTLLESQGMAVYKLKSCRISDKRLFGDNLVTGALDVQIQSVVLGAPTATSGQTVPLKVSYAVAGLDDDETFPADVVVMIAGAGGTRQVINGTDLKLGSGRFDYSFGVDATLAVGAYTVSAMIRTVEQESNRAEASLALEGAGTTRELMFLAFHPITQKYETLIYGTEVKVGDTVAPKVYAIYTDALDKTIDVSDRVEWKGDRSVPFTALPGDIGKTVRVVASFEGQSQTLSVKVLQSGTYRLTKIVGTSMMDGIGLEATNSLDPPGKKEYEVSMRAFTIGWTSPPNNLFTNDRVRATFRISVPDSISVGETVQIPATVEAEWVAPDHAPSPDPKAGRSGIGIEAVQGRVTYYVTPVCDFFAYGLYGRRQGGCQKTIEWIPTLYPWGNGEIRYEAHLSLFRSTGNVAEARLTLEFTYVPVGR